MNTGEAVVSIVLAGTAMAACAMSGLTHDSAHQANTLLRSLLPKEKQQTPLNAWPKP